MSCAQVCGFIATIMSQPPRRPRWPFSVTRTSYQVGSPWMFDGKMLRGLTGMPMRRNDFANSSLADAEPEPLTLANLMTKSLSASIRFTVGVVVGAVIAWLVLVGIVQLADDGIELELADVGLVAEELFAHLVGGFAHRGRWDAQLGG